MTQDQPDGPALLRHARTTLRNEIRDALPVALHHQIDLIVRVMEIAARESEAGEHVCHAELRKLGEIYDDKTEASEQTAETLEEALLRLNWWLAAELRGGKRDGDEDIYDLLCKTVIARLRIANPDILPKESSS